MVYNLLKFYNIVVFIYVKLGGDSAVSRGHIIVLAGAIERYRTNSCTVELDDSGDKGRHVICDASGNVLNALKDWGVVEQRKGAKTNV